MSDKAYELAMEYAKKHGEAIGVISSFLIITDLGMSAEGCIESMRRLVAEQDAKIKETIMGRNNC